MLSSQRTHSDHKEREGETETERERMPASLFNLQEISCGWMLRRITGGEALALNGRVTATLDQKKALEEKRKL